MIQNKPQTMIPTSTSLRPSRLPCRSSNLAMQSSNTNRPASKLPIRTTTSLNRQQTSSKKSNIPKPVTKQPTPTVQSSIRSRSTTAAGNTHIPSPSNKCTRTTLQTNAPIEQMNSTSSESSIEEQQHLKKLLSIMQDEGYSTWSSIDVKDDIITDSIKKIEIDNIGLVTTWLDTSNRQCLEKPVKEGTS